jgi:hypothetical protein
MGEQMGTLTLKKPVQVPTPASLTKSVRQIDAPVKRPPAAAPTKPVKAAPVAPAVPAKAAKPVPAPPAPAQAPKPPPPPPAAAPPPPFEYRPRVWFQPTVDTRALDIWLPMLEHFTTWPGVLPNKLGDPVRPFKIGIRADLEALLTPGDATALAELKVTLKRYCRSEKYIYACAAPGAQRHDIDGQPVEPVSDADLRMARVDLGKRVRSMVARA